MRKNKELLDEFVKYCEEHPEYRFWQALRNWSEANNIYHDKTDTFFWTTRNGVMDL